MKRYILPASILLTAGSVGYYIHNRENNEPIYYSNIKEPMERISRSQKFVKPENNHIAVLSSTDPRFKSNEKRDEVLNNRNYKSPPGTNYFYGSSEQRVETEKDLVYTANRIGNIFQFNSSPRSLDDFVYNINTNKSGIAETQIMTKDGRYLFVYDNQGILVVDKQLQLNNILRSDLGPVVLSNIPNKIGREGAISLVEQKLAEIDYTQKQIQSLGKPRVVTIPGQASFDFPFMTVVYPNPQDPSAHIIRSEVLGFNPDNIEKINDSTQGRIVRFHVLLPPPKTLINRPK